MFRSSSRMVNPGCQEQSREPYLQVGTGSWVHLTECLVMNNGRFDSRLQGSNGRGREEPWTLHISSRQIWGFSCKKQGAHCRGVRLDEPGSWEVVPFWKAILPPTWTEFAFSHPSVREHHFSFALALGLLTPLVKKKVGCGRRCRP